MNKILEMKNIFINGFKDVDKIEFIKYNKVKKESIDLEYIKNLIDENIENIK